MLVYLELFRLSRDTEIFLCAMAGLGWTASSALRCCCGRATGPPAAPPRTLYPGRGDRPSSQRIPRCSIHNTFCRLPLHFRANKEKRELNYNKQ